MKKYPWDGHMEENILLTHSFKKRGIYQLIKNHQHAKILLTITLITSLILFSGFAYAVTNVTVGTNPYQAAVDSTTNRIYTANQGDATVSVIDGNTNTVISTIPVGAGPVSIVVDTSTHRVYTANQGDNTVSVIDGTPGSGTENTLIATIPVGSAPAGVGIDETTNRVYVGNVFSATTSIIDGTPGSPTENTVIDTVVLSGTATRIGVDPNLNQVYVTNSFSNGLFVIDTTTNTLIDTITVGAAPVEAAVDLNTGFVYTANRASNTVSVVDGNTNTVIDTIPIANGPNGVVIDNNNDRAYVSNVHANTISIIDINTNTVTGSIPVGINPGGIGFNPLTNMVYVANRADTIVSIIDALAPILPTANAGLDQVVDEGDFVTLQGTGTGSGTLMFTWTQIAGPMVTLSDPNIQNPTFTTPLVSSTTVLTFELTVEDAFTTSSPDTVDIVVRDITTFTVPLSPSAAGLVGSVNVGDIEAGTILNLEFDTPPNVLSTGELEQTVVSTGIAGSNVNFDFLVNSEISSSLPPLPVDTALFFDIEPTGIDFSDPATFPPNQLPNSRFLIDASFETTDTFPDGAPIISFFLLDETLNTWDQLGNPVVPNTNKIYVANRAEDTISVIDGTTNLTEETIPIPGGVHKLSFDPTTNTLYATNPFANTVSIIDGLTNTITTTLPTGDGTIGVFAEPVTDRLYVANRGSDTVTVIDTSSNTVITNIPVGSGPVNPTANPNTNRAYSANFFSNDVSVIDTTTNAVIATVPITSLSSGINVDPTTNLVYVGNFGANLVSVIDGNPGSPTENTVIASIPVGGSPSGLAIDPNSNKVYVADTSTDTVSVIDKSVNVVIETINVGDGPTVVRVNENTNRVFVSNSGSNDVTVIDGSTNVVLDTIPAGSGPDGLALNSAVPNPVRDPSTDVIDLATGEILQYAFLGNQPHLSKFAIGGIRPALALGSLGGNSGGSNGGSAPSLDNISFDGVTTSSDNGIIEFGGVLIDKILPENNLPTQTAEVGTLFEIILPFTEDNGVGSLQHVSIYFLQPEDETIHDSQTSIIYQPNDPVEYTNSLDFISNVTAEGVIKSAHKIDITFGMIFNFPTEEGESLDLIVRSWDKYRRSSDIEFKNFLQVIESSSALPITTSSDNTSEWTKSVESSSIKSTTVFNEEFSGTISTFDNEEGQSMTNFKIPKWIKYNAHWWSQNEISKDDFVDGMKYLIEHKVMTATHNHRISILEPMHEVVIPDWVKNNASWWADDLVSDQEFVKAIEWLIEKGVITI